MTTTDTTAMPPSGSIPQAADPGRQLLDPDLYRLGAVVSVLATLVHHVTRGILWGHRVAVVGVEPIPGGVS